MVGIIDYNNTHDMIKVTIDKYPEKKAYQWVLNDNGDTDSVTWGQFYKEARKSSKSLMELGIKKGDKVCIISYTNYKWVLTDVSTIIMGAVTVGIYHSSIASECEYIINHSESKIIFVEDRTQLEKILKIKNKIKNVKKVVLMYGNYDGKKNDWVITHDEFMELGASVNDDALDKKISSVKPDDVATIVYTSGTTGIPKGAVLTHDNLIFSSHSVVSCADVTDDDETFIFLPLAHIFARLDIYLTIIITATTTFCRSIDTIIDDIKIARPHWFASVPRIFEKVHTRIISGAESKGGIALKLFKWACNTGEKVSDRKQADKYIPPFLKFKYALANKLIFSKIQNALGGRIRFCVGGAAPLSPVIAKFFHGAGILICEGYGMTENMSFTNVNRIDHYKFGTVGPPGPGIDVKINDDGEVLCKGRNVMKGYYKMPKETKETIDRDGWLHTGDLGMIDEEGFLTITGRKKDLIITSGGKNIAPSRIEGLLATSKYINQVQLIGDKKKYLSALITLDADNIQEYADNEGINYNSLDDLMTNDKVNRIIKGEVYKLNQDLASFETIKKFTIVPEFTIEDELITATLKLKKNAILDKFKKEIDKMYPDD